MTKLWLIIRIWWAQRQLEKAHQEYLNLIHEQNRLLDELGLPRTYFNKGATK